MFKYVVHKGDTLKKIANRYGITLNALYIANPQIDRGEYVYPGQVLNIPNYYPKKYLYQDGDNLYTIARKFGLTVKELLRANPNIQANNSFLNGQMIHIPRVNPNSIVQVNQEYGFYDFVSNIYTLLEKYPFIMVENIGNSVMGKAIYAIRLGIGKKEVFYSGDWHANEYLTAPLLMKFVEEYASALSSNKTLHGYDITYLYNNYTIWIVPMVNPDGVELVQEGITPDHPYYQLVISINNYSLDFTNWTANIRGVDLNHQWPADWERENERSPQAPFPRKYGGVSPLTEPEAVAIYNFTIRHDFSMVLAFHSQGEVVYWGYKGLEPPESERIVNRFAILSGYIPERTAYSAAGYKDWFIQDYRRPGFTIEVGMGVNPLPISQFSKIYRENLSILLEAPLLY